MPLCFSISRKSDVAVFLILLLLTAPATCMAPPKRSSFSVRVVLPASGCEMMANVRLLFISSLKLTINIYMDTPGGIMVNDFKVIGRLRKCLFSFCLRLSGRRIRVEYWRNIWGTCFSSVGAKLIKIEAMSKRSGNHFFPANCPFRGQK